MSQGQSADQLGTPQKLGSPLLACSCADADASLSAASVQVSLMLETLADHGECYLVAPRVPETLPMLPRPRQILRRRLGSCPHLQIPVLISRQAMQPQLLLNLNNSILWDFPFQDSLSNFACHILPPAVHLKSSQRPIVILKYTQ